VEVKKFLLVIFLLILIAAAYLAGSRGPDPTRWFTTPTPTPTCTATSTPSATATATPTVTPIPPTPTLTATPVPKKKPSKKSRKKHAKKAAVKSDVENTEDMDLEPTATPVEKATAPAPAPPDISPICNAHTLPSAVAELEPNNTFGAPQDLGTLISPGLQVNGLLEKVAQAADTAAADSFTVDPRMETTDLDLDVYTFTASTPFLAVLDCYTHVLGRPSPLNHDNNFQLAIYNESLLMIGSSTQNNPVQSVEISESGYKYYAVVYGVDGTDGSSYRLTITPKESQ
jgi:hypothetical protein